MTPADNVSELRPADRTGDAAQCYVRITEHDHRGFIEFQFSVGDPNLYLEMTLPPAAFREFCDRHGAVHLTAEQSREVDEAERKWRYGEPSDD